VQARVELPELPIQGLRAVAAAVADQVDLPVKVIQQVAMAVHMAAAQVVLGTQTKEQPLLEEAVLCVLFGPVTLDHSHQPIQVICNEMLY
jgi:hypothetical protein